MKTKVLILHTSVGGGIKATALNVAEKLINSSEFEVEVRDIEQVESGIFSSGVRGSYLMILEKISSLWGFLYDSKIILGLTLPLRKFFASFKSKNVLKIMRDFQPAIVISTGVVPSGIVAYLKAKGLYRGKFVTVFSDYHLHPFWVHDESDLFICNIPEQAAELRSWGVPESKIKLTGTLIAEKFYQPVGREEACDRVGLYKTMPVVLLGGAGRARSSLKEIFLQLLRSSKSFQVVVICGTNNELKEDLASISAPDRHPVKVLGFVDNMDIFMSAASVLVYKTGGPSMAEAVAKKLPMVLTDIRPGHEMKNLNYLIKNEIADYARIPREVVYLVEQILDGKIRRNWQQMEERILRPSGAISLVEAINIVKPETPLVAVRNYQENR